MSGYVPADLTGRIFDNIDKRRKSQPDYTGSCNINGQVFRVVAWRNLPSEGERRANFNLKFQNMDDFNREQKHRREAGHLGQKPTPPGEDFDDDIPF